MKHVILIAAFDTISEGTHDYEPLAAALILWLERLPEEAGIDLIRELRTFTDDEDYTPDDMDETIQAACDLLADYAPPYTVVGFHESDGALLGCWPVIPDPDFDVPRVSDLSEVEAGYTGEVLVVNDHGNATLYTVTGWTPETTEHWAVV